MIGAFQQFKSLFLGEKNGGAKNSGAKNSGAKNGATPKVAKDGGDDSAPSFDLSLMSSSLNDTSASLSSERPASRRLAPLLDNSLSNIDSRKNTLNNARRELINEFERRWRGDISLLTQRLRGLIAALWLTAGILLGITGLTAAAQNMQMIAGLPLQDIGSLSRLFLIIGLAGGIGALVFSIALRMRGMVDNNRLQNHSRDFGELLADLSRSIDGELRTYKEQITSDSQTPDSMIANVSRAHLTALEAKLLFQPIDFLTMRDEEQARNGFSSYVTQASNSSGGVLFVSMFLSLLGLAMGTGLGYLLFSPGSEALLSKLLAGPNFSISGYALIDILFLTSLIGYAFAGLFSNSLGALLGPQGMLSKGTADALDAIRSAFFAAEAPTPDDIIDHVENISEILKARLSATSNGGGRSHHSGHDNQTQDVGSASFSNDEVPAWRRPKEAPRFVDPGFQSAPQSWRADPHLDLDGKNISRRSGAKRSLFSFKTDHRN